LEVKNSTQNHVFHLYISSGKTDTHMRKFALFIALTLVSYEHYFFIKF